jgi:hypothetical protein
MIGMLLVFGNSFAGDLLTSGLENEFRRGPMLGAKFRRGAMIGMLLVWKQLPKRIAWLPKLRSCADNGLVHGVYYSISLALVSLRA